MKPYLLLFFLFLIPNISFGKISINWDFDSGSLDKWEQQDNKIILTPAEEAGSLWYYFQITGVKDQTLTFEFQSANNNFYGEHKIPVISYDNENWMFLYQRFIFNNTENSSKINFQFTHTFTEDQAWIAYTPPYNNTRLNQWLEKHKESKSLKVIELGKTSMHSLPLNVLQFSNESISNASKTSWMIFCREDSYETASTWLGMGAADFLLSEDPLAKEVLLQSNWYIVPIFDRDGVKDGHALHPDPVLGPNYFWTEAWSENVVSFHEQRLFKSFLQDLKDQGTNMNGFFRVHSNSWQNNVIRPEQLTLPAENTEEQPPSINFFQSLHANYLPWFMLQDPLNLDSRISKFVKTLFPDAITSFIQTEFVYPNAFGTTFLLYKPADDIMTEGEKLVRKVAQKIGISPSEIPPQILAHDFYLPSLNPNQQYHVRCVYQDALNRPPTTVEFRMNENAIQLRPLSNEQVNFRQGVIFTGFVNIQEEINNASFYVSNGVTEKEIKIMKPQQLPQQPSN